MAISQIAAAQAAVRKTSKKKKKQADPKVAEKPIKGPGTSLDGSQALPKAPEGEKPNALSVLIEGSMLGRVARTANPGEGVITEREKQDKAIRSGTPAGKTGTSTHNLGFFAQQKAKKK